RRGALHSPRLGDLGSRRLVGLRPRRGLAPPPRGTKRQSSMVIDDGVARRARRRRAHSQKTGGPNDVPSKTRVPDTYWPAGPTHHVVHVGGALFVSRSKSKN